MDNLEINGKMAVTKIGVMEVICFDAFYYLYGI